MSKTDFEKEIAAVKARFKGGDEIDDESAITHYHAETLLASRGIHDPSTEQYLEAVEAVADRRRPNEVPAIGELLHLKAEMLLASRGISEYDSDQYVMAVNEVAKEAK